ncbi:MAG: hypothetical protein U0L42_01510 [Methanobrevibacter sp.]|uniref:hypothetical protein n=1 Tax=Methanobrevibacter sp. TaxID=66852 RepID=UPI002E7741C8|nr:hypothetical protein [Methanobrevibacter sp.]MEE0934327.1 hypothetical protein [Methanobrevibacter sp.]
MAEFQEDMLFKNVSDEDVSILLEILGKKSKRTKVWTKELRHIDPTNSKPDLILDLDEENLIVEFQSTEVGNDFSRRAHSYVALTDQHKKNDKEVNLSVLSTAEDSKIVEYRYNRLNVFKYEVHGLNNLDGEEIINNVKTKLKYNEPLDGRDIILLSLVPLSKKGKNIVEYIYRVIKILFNLKNLTSSQKDLSFGIMWLTTDKFVVDSLERNIICDLLGGRMSLIHEYGENKYRDGKDDGIEQGIEQGIEKIIVNLLKSGEDARDIAKNADVALEKVLEIKNKNNL